MSYLFTNKLGRHVPPRAIEVYHTSSQTLRPVRDATDGSVVNEWVNRPHYRGKDLILNPTCLISTKVTCALCLDSVWPIEEKVVHVNAVKACRAAFHLDRLDRYRLDGHHYPVCWQQVGGESQEESEEKLEMDVSIRKDFRPARQQPFVLGPAVMRYYAEILKLEAHPEYYDLHAHEGPAPESMDPQG